MTDDTVPVSESSPQTSEATPTLAAEAPIPAPNVPVIEIVAQPVPEPAPSTPETELEVPKPEPTVTSSNSGPVVNQASVATSTIGNHVLDQNERKRGNSKRLQNRDEALAKILAFARTKAEITNDDIEKLLHCSDATASRYLKMLVVRGQLTRRGKGRGAAYALQS